MEATILVTYDGDVPEETLRALADGVLHGLHREIGNGLLTDASPECTVESHTVSVVYGKAAATRSRLLSGIAECLWPDGDPAHEWDSETLARIGELMEAAGFKPTE